MNPNKDSEEYFCCPNVKVSSSGRAGQLYPSLMGEYKVIEERSVVPVYKKTGEDMYLYKPSDTPGKKYSWSVSHSPNISWGYLEGGLNGDCPDHVPLWRVFDINTRRWTKDVTISVLCRN